MEEEENKKKNIYCRFFFVLKEVMIALIYLNLIKKFEWIFDMLEINILI